MLVEALTSITMLLLILPNLLVLYKLATRPIIQAFHHSHNWHPYHTFTFNHYNIRLNVSFQGVFSISFGYILMVHHHHHHHQMVMVIIISSSNNNTMIIMNTKELPHPWQWTHRETQWQTTVFKDQDILKFVQDM